MFHRRTASVGFVPTAAQDGEALIAMLRAELQPNR
jgi:hypothetical protein